MECKMYTYARALAWRVCARACLFLLLSCAMCERARTQNDFMEIVFPIHTQHTQQMRVRVTHVRSDARMHLLYINMLDVLGV